MKTDLPLRPKLDERIKVAIAPDEKRRLFELAATRQTTVSELVRQALHGQALHVVANSPTAA